MSLPQCYNPADAIKERKRGIFVKAWQKGAISLGALGLAGIFLPRRLWFKKAHVAEEGQPRALALSDRTKLAVTHLKRGHDRLIIIAHGFLKSMNDPVVVQLTQMLAEQFDVLAFDFPGHGRSGGRSDASLSSAANHFSRVLDHAHTLGYRQIGAVGYGSGAAAIIIAAAQSAPLDAIVSIASPVSASTTRGHGPRPTWPWRWWAGLMGTRLAAKTHLDAWPIDYIARVSPIPLLIVGQGTTRQRSDALFAVAKPPKEYLAIPWPLQASSPPFAARIIAWLDKTIPNSDANEAS